MLVKCGVCLYVCVCLYICVCVCACVCVQSSGESSVSSLQPIEAALALTAVLDRFRRNFIVDPVTGYWHSLCAVLRCVLCCAVCCGVVCVLWCAVVYCAMLWCGVLWCVVLHPHTGDTAAQLHDVRC